MIESENYWIVAVVLGIIALALRSLVRANGARIHSHDSFGLENQEEEGREAQGIDPPREEESFFGELSEERRQAMRSTYSKPFGLTEAETLMEGLALQSASDQKVAKFRAKDAEWRRKNSRGELQGRELMLAMDEIEKRLD